MGTTDVPATDTDAAARAAADAEAGGLLCLEAMRLEGGSEGSSEGGAATAEPSVRQA